MLLTVTSTAANATDLGYLLHKHPDKVHTFDLSIGRATVCYPEADESRCTAALLLEVDPVSLVRGGPGAVGGFVLGQYVNDRPYAASSLLAVALGRVFGTALGGRCAARPDLVDIPIPLEIYLPALPARATGGAGGAGGLAGAALVRALFEPLGWRVDAREVRLADEFGWGPAPYVDTRLTGLSRLADALAQLYVLLPALDDGKHYWVGPDEVDKIVRRGEGWLSDHPHRDLILRRNLADQGRYVRAASEQLDAAARLAALDDGVADLSGQADSDAEPCDERPAEAPKSLPLKAIRRDEVLRALRDVGAHRVVDAGCGEGFYLAALLADPAFAEIVGVDVSVAALDRAARRLELDRLSDRRRERVTLRQSSLAYRDDSLAGFDALLLVEVIEHVDPDRLPAVERNVFGAARPAAVVVTTPNAEYNVRYGIPAGAFRHADHRFEWSRTEFGDWVARMGRAHGYDVEHRPVGEVDPEVGPPTQLALFTRTAAR